MIHLLIVILRSVAKPWGINKAHEGTIMIIPLKVRIKITRIPSTKLSKGDLLKIVTGSGGGFGNPKQRKKEHVLSDIENGFISKGDAEKIYNFKQ